MIKKADIYPILIGILIGVLYCVVSFNKSHTIAFAWQGVQHTYYKVAVSLTGNAEDLANLGEFYWKQDQNDLAEPYLLQAAAKGNVRANAMVGMTYFFQNKENHGEQYVKFHAD